MARPIPTPSPIPFILDHVTAASNLTYVSWLRNCSSGSSCDPDPDEWTDTSRDVLYVALPVLLILGVLLNLVSLVVLARCVRISNDSYLLGLALCNLLLLTCGGALHLQDYLGHSDLYQHAYGYLRSLHSWLWYSALWVVMVMTLERSMNLTPSRDRSLCSSVQAGVVVAMVLIVCLVSALPEFFEYEVVEIFDFAKNRTVALSRPSPAADSVEYKVMYFWYSMSISVFLPYPFLLIMLVLLSQRMKHARHKRKCLSSVKQGSGSGQILNRKITEDLHVTRLCVVLILLYYLLTSPYTACRLLAVVHADWFSDQPALARGLQDIFEFVFYAYFAILFFLLCSYNDKFRRCLADTCCCCCFYISTARGKRKKKRKK